MRLPPGATGSGPPPGAPVDLKAFTGICHYAARTIGATVTGVTAGGVTPTFHTIALTADRQDIEVLRHTVVPFIAFARPRPDEDLAITFVDHPALGAAITGLTDVHVCTVAELDTSLSRADLSALRPVEHDQIRYWQPATVGEVLFNFWD